MIQHAPYHPPARRLEQLVDHLGAQLRAEADQRAKRKGQLVGLQRPALTRSLGNRPRRSAQPTCGRRPPQPCKRPQRVGQHSARQRPQPRLQRGRDCVERSVAWVVARVREHEER
eukprot:349629-Chlamydomonas_euryale.AAC.1